MPKIIVILAQIYSSLHFTKIVFKPLRTNLFNIVLLSIFLSLGYSNLYSQDIKKKQTTIPANKQEVKKPVEKDTTKNPIA